MRKLVYLLTVLLLSLCAIAQQRTVSGKITNTTGEPLAGASVAEKGTSNAALTKADGSFAMILTTADPVLVVSFIGYEKEETVVGNSAELNIQLTQQPKALNTVVVTGYSSQRKADLTGAVSVVSLSEVKDIPTGNPMRALQGRVPGLYVEATGQPNGSNSKVLIRGLNTLGDPNPLYIIDGIPTKDPMVFGSINPSAIASVQVLKDASAASIYGARASNGVIIVTTKDGRGRAGQERVSVQFNASVSTQTEKPWREDALSSEGRGRALWQAAVNDKTNPNNAIYTYDWNGDYNNPVLNKVNIAPYVGGDTLQPAGNTNWQDASYERAIIEQYDLSLTAGTNKSSLLVNLGYYKNTGMLVYTHYHRYTTRVNAYTTFLDGKVKVGENIQLARSSETLASNDLGGVATPELAVTLAPTIPVFRTDGTYAGPIGAGYSDRNNPVHMQYINRWDKNNRLNILGNVYAEITPVKGLVLRTSLGADYTNSLFKNIEPAFVEGFLSRSVNSLSEQQGNDITLTWTNTANYQFTLQNKHKLNALLGTESIREDFQGFGAFREGFAVEDEDYYVLDAGTGRSTNNGSATGYRLFSLFGKVNYAFGDKYLASATLRRDGSSRFGTENQYGFFPAFTLGWRINNEEFFKNIDYVSNLKLRAGIGRVGNQEIGNTARFGLYQTNYGTLYNNGVGFPGQWLNVGSAYDLNGLNQGTLPSGYVQVQGENQNLKWESTDELNVGVDFGLFNEKITGSFDYFTRKTKDILIQPPIAGAVGEGRVKWLNGASKNNKGWELLLGYNNKIGELNYSISGNAAHFKDRITELPEEVRTAYPGNVEKTIVGHSQLSVFGYKTDGIFKSQEEVDKHAAQTGKGIGRIKYVDLNGDNKIDALDQDWLGTLLPSLEYGFRIDLDYRNFDLSIFGSGVAGKTGFDPARQFNSFAAVNQNNGPGVLDAWTPKNPDSNTPMLSLVNSNDEFRTSDFFMVNGSYFKLRNVQLGYTMPKSVTSKVKMETLRFYFIGQNLFAIKSNEYLSKDPERIGGFANWPQPTTYTLGANLTF
ncbi:TonB-dependent receptor [Chitinophagaceae bacterium LB-8]|uniref:TonB-dependent receptor n=1 Tax=Paraflavisolibacter caeni TaxID=2982496 RepID=A0A9X2XUF8_9BACT|nr:TonB-dependent receptor [Paraflavisolibacter caeni]MCU7548697.1 TonB-dependent receptor [Paraflavisolibacter caeni]